MGCLSSVLMELQQEALALPEAGNVDLHSPSFSFQGRERWWHPGFSFPKAESFRQTRWRGRECQRSWLKTCVRVGVRVVTPSRAWPWPALHFLKSLNCPITMRSEPLHKSFRAPGKPDEPGWCQRISIKQVKKPRYQIQQGAQRRIRLDGVGETRLVAGQP